MRGTADPALRSALEGLKNVEGCRVGLCAEGLEGPLAGTRFCVRAEEALPSASLIKVLVLAELLRQADSGRVSLGQRVSVGNDDLVEDSEMVGAERLPAELTVGRLAEGMISVSDNTATNLLISLLGEGRINVLARDLGLRRTALRRKMMDFAARSRGEENLTSASDMTALLAAIWNGTFLSPRSRDLALDLLGRQGLTSRIPLSLQPGARFLHKTGELEHVENDAGLVVLPEGTFALAILTLGDLEKATLRIEVAVVHLCEAFGGTRIVP